MNIQDAIERITAREMPTDMSIGWQCIDIEHYNEADIDALSNALSLNLAHLPKGLRLSLDMNHLSSEHIVALTNRLSLSYAPNTLRITRANYTAAFLPSSLAEYESLFTALSSGDMPEGLNIDLFSRNVVTAQEIALLSTTLSSGRAPKDLTLRLICPSLTDEDVRRMFTAIASEHTPQGLTLKFSSENISHNNHNNISGITDFTPVSNLLASGLAPQGLTLDLENFDIDDESAGFIADALSSGNAPPKLTLALGLRNRLSLIGIQALSNALSSGFAPPELTISLQNNSNPNRYKFNIDMMRSLSDMLSSGNAPRGLTLDLSCNSISDESAALLFHALSSERAPQGITIDLSYHNLSDEGISALIQILKQGRHPDDLTILGIPKIKAALDQYRVAYACVALHQRSILERADNTRVRIDGLPTDVVSYVAGYLHPAGETIGNNVNNFFYMKSIKNATLKTLGIDATKVSATLGLEGVDKKIKDVFKMYYRDTMQPPSQRAKQVKLFEAALKNIHSEVNQTLVLKAFNTTDNMAAEALEYNDYRAQLPCAIS